MIFLICNLIFASDYIENLIRLITYLFCLFKLKFWMIYGEKHLFKIANKINEYLIE